jgi:hypothetical protein
MGKTAVLFQFPGAQNLKEAFATLHAGQLVTTDCLVLGVRNSIHALGTDTNRQPLYQVYSID